MSSAKKKVVIKPALKKQDTVNETEVKEDEKKTLKSSTNTPVISEDEGDDDEMFQIFDIMHNSVEGMKEKFTAFYEQPNKTNYNEFDELIVEFISLARDLKNMTKSLLPPSEKEHKPEEKRGRKKSVIIKQEEKDNTKN